MKYLHTKINDYIKESYIDNNGNLEDMSQEDINEILKGYIDCALWTEEERLKQENDTYSEEDEEDYNDMSEIDKIVSTQSKFNSKSFDSFTSEDIDVNSKIEAYKDIKKFIQSSGDKAIEEAISENGLDSLGMDIWLTRNRHGAGFFDRGYKNQDILEKSALDLGEKYLVIGDDGLLYFE